jgi:hypothetical protein
MVSGKQEPAGVHGCNHSVAGSDGSLLSGSGCVAAGVGGAVEELLAVRDEGGVTVEGLTVPPRRPAFRFEGSLYMLSNIARRKPKHAHLNCSSTRKYNPIHLRIALQVITCITTICVIQNSSVVRLSVISKPVVDPRRNADMAPRCRIGRVKGAFRSQRKLADNYTNQIVNTVIRNWLNDVLAWTMKRPFSTQKSKLVGE